MKYMICVDLEGVACAVGRAGGPISGNQINNEFARHQATNEANAAARALFDNGASYVVIWDNHSSGVNLLYDDLDPRVHIALGAGGSGRFPLLDNTYSGILYVGYHAMDEGNGIMAHTYSSDTLQHMHINDIPMGEMGIDAAIAGEIDVPVIFVSSDSEGAKEANSFFPWAKTVATKQFIAWNRAVSMHPKAACDVIYSGVTEAVEDIESMQSYKISQPVKVEVRYKRMDAAQGARLTDMEGKPFELINPFTRCGMLRKLSDYFI